MRRAQLLAGWYKNGNASYRVKRSNEMESTLKTVLCLQLLFFLQPTAGLPKPNLTNLTLASFRERVSTYEVNKAPTIRPPNLGNPRVINLLHEPKIHGFLGDAPVPGYDGVTSQSPSPNNKWRIVCERLSQVFVLVMNIEMEEGASGGNSSAGQEYLQIRRKMVNGTSNRLYSYNLKLNSILIAHVNARMEPSNYYPFRIAYFCVPLRNVDYAEELFKNNCILKFLEEEPWALEDVDWLLQSTDYNAALLRSVNSNPRLAKISDIEGYTALELIYPDENICDLN